MDIIQEILRSLGRIEGQLAEIHKLSERVTALEVWQSWLKGAWTVLLAAFAYLCKQTFGNAK